MGTVAVATGGQAVGAHGGARATATTTTVAQTLEPHQDSATMFDGTVSPRSARPGTAVTVTANHGVGLADSAG